MSGSDRGGGNSGITLVVVNCNIDGDHVKCDSSSGSRCSNMNSGNGDCHWWWWG